MQFNSFTIEFELKQHFLRASWKVLVECSFVLPKSYCLRMQMRFRSVIYFPVSTVESLPNVGGRKQRGSVSSLEKAFLCAIMEFSDKEVRSQDIFGKLFQTAISVQILERCHILLKSTP